MSGISLGNNNMSEIWFGKNRIYPSASVMAYSLTNVHVVYSDGAVLHPSQSNYATIQGTFIIKQDGVVISNRAVTLTPSISGSMANYFMVSDNKIYFNKSQYGKTNLYSTYGNSYSTTWNCVFNDISVSATVVTYSNRPETTLNTTGISCTILNEEDISPIGENLNITMNRYNHITVIYSSGLQDETKTPLPMILTDIYTGETPSIPYMQLVTSTTNSSYSIPIGVNTNQSRRTIYVIVKNNNNETDTQSIDQDECYMALYSETEGEYIESRGTYYAYGDTEFVITDYGDNTNNYSVIIEGSGHEYVDWDSDGGTIWIYNLVSSHNLTVTIYEENTSHGIMFYLKGE